MREAIAMYDALLADDRWEAMTIASARIDAVRLDSARHRLLRMEHEWALARVHAAELIRERDHVWKLRDEADARAADLANRNRLQDDELAQLEAVNRRLLGKSAHQPNQKAEAVSTERMLDKLRRRMRSRRPGEG